MIKIENLKICKTCGVIFPKTTKYFEARKNSDGFYAKCRYCLSERRRELYSTFNKEKIIKKNREYYTQNRQIAIERVKKHYAENKEEIRKKHKAYREKHREEDIIRCRENYHKNKEAFKKRAKIYCQTHLEEFRIYKKKREAKLKKLPHNLTLKQWRQIKLYFDNKCAYCGKEEALQQEHFVALENGGEYTANNIIPACRSCNCSKQDKDFFEWYPKQKFYSKKREKAILKYLGYKNNVQQLKMT